MTTTPPKKNNKYWHQWRYNGQEKKVKVSGTYLRHHPSWYKLWSAGRQGWWVQRRRLSGASIVGRCVVCVCTLLGDTLPFNICKSDGGVQLICNKDNPTTVATILDACAWERSTFLEKWNRISVFVFELFLILNTEGVKPKVNHTSQPATSDWELNLEATLPHLKWPSNRCGSRCQDANSY